jgi:hypothetical protein
LPCDVVPRVDRAVVEGTADTIVCTTDLPQSRPTDESRKAYDDPVLSTRMWETLTDDVRPCRVATVVNEVTLGGHWQW